MATHSTSAVFVSSPRLSSPRMALLEGAQQVLQQLEESLERGLRALLDLNCAELERETAEQRRFVLQFNDVLQRCAQNSRVDSGGVNPKSQPERELIEEIRLRQARVWQAARLQAAVLTRAQSKLRMLAQMLAGPSAAYGPFPPPRRSASAIHGGRGV